MHPRHASPHFIYLASQSPRRQQLLEQVGVRFQLLLPGASEDVESLEHVKPGERPAAYVQRVTLLKMQAALSRMQARALPVAPVLCADTTVALGRQILGKPVDSQDARRMLQRLSGVTHRVLTAVCLGYATAGGLQLEHALSVSRVRFSELTPQQIDAYLASAEPMGKAGAYAVQGGAAAFTERISGSYSGIMGLPLFETCRLLSKLDGYSYA
jgi:septum formation protein